MLNKSQVITIPLDSFVTKTKKFFFFSGEPIYDMEKIEKIDNLVNVTEKMKDVVSTLFLLKHPKTNFSTTKKDNLNNVPILTTYEVNIENDFLIIHITDSIEIKSNGIRDIEKYKTVVSKNSNDLEEVLNKKVDEIVKVIPKSKKKSKLKTSIKSTSKSKYRNSNSYNQYRDDNDFWDYYLMYSLFFDDGYNDYDDYEFYDEYEGGSDTLIDLPTESPEEFYEDTKYEGNSYMDDENDYESSNISNDGVSDTSVAVGMAAGAYAVNEILEDENTVEESFEDGSDTDMAVSSFAYEMSPDDNESVAETESFVDDSYEESNDSDES